MRNSIIDIEKYITNDMHLNEGLKPLECEKIGRSVAKQLGLQYNDDDSIIAYEDNVKNLRYAQRKLSRIMKCTGVEYCWPNKFYYIVLLFDE